MLAALNAVAPTGAVVSSGDLTALTSEQQAQIKEGTIVTTTDGRRWVYSGSGDKTLEASYVELSDITPDWNSITNKPAIDVNGTADSLVQRTVAGGGNFNGDLFTGDLYVSGTFWPFPSFPTDVPVKMGGVGEFTTGAFGTGALEFCEGNDARVVNAVQGVPGDATPARTLRIVTQAEYAALTPDANTVYFVT